MAQEKEKAKKMFVGVVWNCSAELKLLTVLLVLCSLATLFQFLSYRLSLSPSDLRLCVSRLSSETPLSPPLSTAAPPSEPPPPPPSIQEDQILDGGIIKRAFNPYGAAAYTFIQMGTYRGGPNTFAIIGLASKPLHVYGKPQYQCEWIPDSGTNNSIITSGYKILPDWGYGRVYTVVVVNCTFPVAVGVDGSGGSLVLHASTGGGGDRNVNTTEKIEALRQAPGSLNSTELFTSLPQFDYFYCGSPLHGNLSPQRIKEWIAYHVKLFGQKSHFVIHDAGGVHPEVLS